MDGSYRYYNDPREFISASNVCYIQRELCEQWMAAGYNTYIYSSVKHIIIFYRHHCWVNFEGSAEIYNEMMRETCNDNFFNMKRYLQKHPMKATGIMIIHTSLFV